MVVLESLLGFAEFVSIRIGPCRRREGSARIAEYTGKVS